MIVGFTGSRTGMTPAQSDWLRMFFANNGPTQFHHGACVGSDAQAALFAAALPDCDVVAWPGVSAAGRESPDRDESSIRCSHAVMPESTHFARNRNVVDASDVLIAMPSYAEPIAPATKGGTAYTVCYARKRGKRVIVVRPDGTVEDSAPAGAK